MIKNCIIYLGKNDIRINTNINENFSDSSLKNCVNVAEKNKKKRLEDLSKIAKNESLSFDKKGEDYYQLISSCEFIAPRLTASGTTPFIRVNHKLWLCPEERSAISFDAGRKLSEVGIALLSYGVNKNPTEYNGVKILKEGFINLKEWILKDGEGQIRQINLKNISKDGVIYKQVQLSAGNLEESNIFIELLEEAHSVSSMSFLSPKLQSTERSISCRINNWGCVSIFTPNMLDIEIMELIKMLIEHANPQRRG